MLPKFDSTITPESFHVVINGVALPDKQTFEELKALCGFMIATLRVNYDRGSLTSANQAEFLALIESWEKRIAAIK